MLGCSSTSWGNASMTNILVWTEVRIWYHCLITKKYSLKSEYTSGWPGARWVSTSVVTIETTNHLSFLLARQMWWILLPGQCKKYRAQNWDELSAQFFASHAQSPRLTIFNSQHIHVCTHAHQHTSILSYILTPSQFCNIAGNGSVVPSTSHPTKTSFPVMEP